MNVHKGPTKKTQFVFLIYVTYVDFRGSVENQDQICSFDSIGNVGASWCSLIMFASTNANEAFQEANCRRSQHLAIFPMIAPPTTGHGHGPGHGPGHGHVSGHGPDHVQLAWQGCRNKTDGFLFWVETRRGVRLRRRRCPELLLGRGAPLRALRVALHLYMETLLRALAVAGVGVAGRRLGLLLDAVGRGAQRMERAVLRRADACSAACPFSSALPVGACDADLVSAMEALSDALLNVIIFQG